MLIIMFDEFLNYFDPMTFLLSLAIGLFYVYVSHPTPRIIYKYPTPFNVGKVTYIDENNTCYKYAIKEVDCPKNQSEITYFPVQQVEQKTK